MEGVAEVGMKSGTGTTAEFLSGAWAGREVGFGLDFVLGFDFFSFQSSLLDNLIFLEVLFPIFLFLFFMPLPPVVVAAVYDVGFTT